MPTTPPEEDYWIDRMTPPQFVNGLFDDSDTTLDYLQKGVPEAADRIMTLKRWGEIDRETGRE